MAGRGHQGPEPLTAQRELFGRLISAGVSNSEACRTVGVNRKTGTRWRFGRSIPTSAGGDLHYPPVLSTRLEVVSPRYLSEDERGVIADLHRAGMSARLIATEIGRSPSTVSRELARNTGPGCRYGVAAAQRLAAARRCRPRLRRLWSATWCCVGSYSSAWTFGGARNRTATPWALSSRTSRPGSWPYIMGAGNRSAIGTLVERSTRTVILVHLPHGRSAAAVRDALIGVFTDLPATLGHSLTWDPGKEMSAHADLAATVGMPVFFCDPHSPWQRGSNENMNGLLRDYFPKGTNLAVHPAERLIQVAAELNDRPRKTLNWATPAALLAPHLTASAAPVVSPPKTVVLRR